MCASIWPVRGADVTCSECQVKNHTSFVVELVDPSTRDVVDDSFLRVENIPELCELLDVDATDLNRGAVYELDASEIVELQEKYRFSFSAPIASSSMPIVRFRAWRQTDDLPYKIHTNRELSMMLAGQKPLAVFAELHPSRSEASDIPEPLFQPYVESGRFFREEFIQTASKSEEEVTSTGNTIRYVFYSLPSEQWRIPAYILLLKAAAKSGWSEGMERIQGSLLGYEDWQNDAYIEHIAQRPTPAQPSF